MTIEDRARALDLKRARQLPWKNFTDVLRTLGTVKIRLEAERFGITASKGL